MESLRLNLRFRDVVANIDTINEHKKIIEQHGKVLWGWWKKTWEISFSSAFKGISDTSLREIVLIDREKQRAYLASCEHASDRVESDRFRYIPSYYRDQHDKVSGWFLFTKIVEVKYDPKLASRIGESTYLITDGVLDCDDGEPLNASTADDRDIILHLSDLHFGDDYAFLPPKENARIGEERYTFTECLIADLDRQGFRDRVGLVIITGDFTTRGDWCDRTRRWIIQEMEDLLKELKLEKTSLLVAPGNHDIVRFSSDVPIDVDKLAVDNQMDMQHEREYRFFRQSLTQRPIDQSLNYWERHSIGGVEVDIAVLNSCAITATKWTEYGYVNPEGVEVLSQVAKHDSNSNDSLKILALHHHLVPVARVDSPQRNGVSLTLNSVELLEAAINFGFQLALHGHQHLARISTYGHVPLKSEQSSANQVFDPITIVSGGSSGANHDRRPGEERNTYSLITVKKGDRSLIMRELRPDKKPGAELYNVSLPIHGSNQGKSRTGTARA